MGFGWRAFLFEQSGQIRHISRKLTSAILQKDAALPEYAGQSLRVAFVHLAFLNRKPMMIPKIETSRWTFDNNGLVEGSYLEECTLRLDLLVDPSSDVESHPVIDATRRLKEKRLQELLWKPTPSEVKQLKNMIWKPKEKSRHVKKRNVVILPFMRSSKSKTLKNETISEQDKEVLPEIIPPLSDIRLEISMTDDDTLETISSKISKNYLPTADGIQRCLLEGIKTEIEQELAIRCAWQTGEGRWFAIATKKQAEDHKKSSTLVEQIELVECDGIQSAFKAIGKLNEKYADLFDEKISVELEIMPELEYRKEVLGE